MFAETGNRKGSVLASVVIVVGIVLGLSLLLTYTTIQRTASQKNIIDTAKAKLAAESGIEEALVTLTQSEKHLQESYSFKGKVGKATYNVVISKLNDGKHRYLIKSTGKKDGAIREIDVVVELTGEPWVPFYFNSLEIDKELISPKWEDAKIYVENVKIGDKEGKEAKDELKELGFKVLDKATKPDFNWDIIPQKIKEEENKMFSNFLDYEKNIPSVSKFYCNNTLTVELGNNEITTQCGSKSQTLELNQSNLNISLTATKDITISGTLRSGGRNKNLNLFLYTPENITIKTSNILSSGSFKNLNLNFIAKKEIKADALRVGSFNVEKNFSLNLIGKTVKIDNDFSIASASFGDNLDLKILGDSINIKKFRTGSFSVNKNLNIGIYAKNQYKIDELDINSLSAGLNINTNLLSLNEGEIKNLNLQSFSNSQDINVNVGALNKLEIENFKPRSFSARKNFNINIYSKDNEIDSLNIGSMSAQNKENIKLIGDSVKIKSGINFSSLSSNRNTILVMANNEISSDSDLFSFSSGSILGESFFIALSNDKIEVDNDIYNFSSGSAESNIHLITLAKNEIESDYLENILSGSFDSNIFNTFISKETSGNIDYESLSILSSSYWSVISNEFEGETISFPSFFFFLPQDILKGISLKTLKDLCNNVSSEYAKLVYCNLLNSNKGKGNNKVKIISWKVL